MGMTGGVNRVSVYDAADEAESLATLHRALDLGVTLLDTADLDGPLLNERPIEDTVGAMSRLVEEGKVRRAP